MRLMMIILFAMSAIGQAAMTREQICIEQSDFCHSNPSNKRGALVWQPVGKRSDTWLMTNLIDRDSAVDSVAAWEIPESFVCRCKPGSYVSGILAGEGLSFPGGNFVATMSPIRGAVGWRYIHNVSVENRYIRFTVPNDTTRLYMTTRTRNYAAITAIDTANKTFTVATNLTGCFRTPGKKIYVSGSTGGVIDGFYTLVSAVYGSSTVITVAEDIASDPAANGTLYFGYGKMNVSVNSGTATLTKSQWNLDYYDPLTEDFKDPRTSDSPSFFGFELIATNCGGAVIDFIGAGNVDLRETITCGGLICIKDNGDVSQCNPFDGVLDPSSLVEVMPYEPVGGAGQTAEGPLSLRFDAETGFWWGLGHWDANNTLISSTQQLSYQDAADGVWKNWLDADTDNARVVTKALSFGRTLTGTMQCRKVSAATNYSVGTYTAVYSFNASGLTITLDHVFNSTAVTQGLKLLGPTSGSGVIGGYGGQWSIVKGFGSKIKILPSLGASSSYLINTGAFTNNLEVLSKLASQATIYGNQFEAHIQGEGTFISGGILKSTPYLIAVERAGTLPAGRDVAEREWMKIYFGNVYGEGSVTLAENDRVLGRHVRIVTARNDLGTQSGGGTSAIFGGGGLFK